MVEVVGDYLEASEIKVPHFITDQPLYSGALFMSGAKLYISTDVAALLITSE